MKKLIILVLVLGMGTYLSSCSKDDDNNSGDNNGGATPAKTCYLKSYKEAETSGTKVRYEGFVLYYDNENNIIKANQLDSISGNEDSSTQIRFTYNNDKLQEYKVFTNNVEVISNKYTYNKDLVAIGVLNNPITGDITQRYFYDASGRITYSVVTYSFFGTNYKDSAVYQGYNSFNRPTSITAYSTTIDDQGVEDPYEFYEEYSYEYDAKGNRTKTSYRDDENDPFEEQLSTTFNLNKTVGAAEPAFRLIGLIGGDDWDDPNLNGSNVDLNLPTSKTEVEDGVSITTNTEYTFDANENVATSKESTTTGNITSTFTYDCK